MLAGKQGLHWLVALASEFIQGKHINLQHCLLLKLHAEQVVFLEAGLHGLLLVNLETQVFLFFVVLLEYVLHVSVLVWILLDQLE